MSDETAPRILNLDAAGMLLSPAGVVWQNRRLVRISTDRQIRPARAKTNHLLDDVPFSVDHTVRHMQTALRDVSGRSDPCAGEAIENSTKNYPIRSPDVDWACVDIKGIQGAAGHVGVDPVMGDCATGQCYSPGNNHTDPFYGACVMSNSGCNSYYKVQHFWNGGNDFPFGIFITNADKNYCVDAPWSKGARYWRTIGPTESAPFISKFTQTMSGTAAQAFGQMTFRASPMAACTLAI